MQPKPQGYGDDFTTKCGHCNGIHVNGIHAQGNSAKSFALATKKTMTYCGKCICLCSKTTPSSHCTYWKSFWIVNWATSIQEYRIIRRYGNLKLSSSGFLLRSSIKTRSIEESTLEKFALKNAKSYNKQFITRKVVQYGCIFTCQNYFFSPKRLEKIKLTRKNTQRYCTTFCVITSLYIITPLYSFTKSSQAFLHDCETAVDWKLFNMIMLWFTFQKQQGL